MSMQEGRKGNGEKTFTVPEGRKFSDKVLDIGSQYTEVENMALKNKIRLKTALLAPGIRSVGIQSFSGCTSMHTVSFGKLEKIQREAFLGCTRLKEVQIPGSVSYLGEGAFRDCKRLEEVSFHQSAAITVIKKETFQGCAGLKRLSLPWRLLRIEERGFYRCQSLEQIHLGEFLESIGREAFYFNGFKRLELPENLRILGDSAFFKSMQLEYVRIPPSVTRIGKWVFHGSNRLKILEIGHDPEVIGDWITNKSTVIRCRKGSRMEEYCRKLEIQTEWL